MFLFSRLDTSARLAFAMFLLFFLVLVIAEETHRSTPRTDRDYPCSQTRIL